MEISERSENNFEKIRDSKTEGNAWEARRSRGGSRRSSGKRMTARRESVPADLEAEETKGFTDLGFVFTEEDLNSELPDILPGLRTFLHGEEESKTEWSVPRPYLSEAWDFYSDKWSGRTEKESVVIDLRMAALCGETNMKDCLKWWARSVASNLK